MSSLAEQQRSWLLSLFNTGTLTPGMNVYRKHFLGVHGRALQDTYPLTAALLGKHHFRVKAQQLLCQHPVSSGDLNDFGDALSAVLEQDPKAPSGSHQLADFEWQKHLCLRQRDSTEASRITPDNLPALNLTNVRLVASCILQHYLWRVDLYAAGLTESLERENVRLLLFRQGNSVFQRELSQQECELIQLLNRPQKNKQHSAGILKDSQSISDLSVADTQECIDLLQFLLQAQLLTKEE